MTLLLMLLLKSLLVFAFAAAALLGLRRASAAARHLVCLLTLVSLLALPLFSVTLPGWHLPVLAQAQVAETALPEPTPSRSSSTLPKREGEEFRAQPLSTPLRPPVSGGPLQSEERTKQGGGFLALYVIGVLLASLRPLLGLWGIHRLHRLCVDADDAPALDAATQCAALLRLGVPRLCRADVPVPMTWGGHRPVVLLPASSCDWPDDRLRSVLLHEMAHIKRRDWSCHRFADLVCALYWFHPLVWLTARRLRTESELACDDLVLSFGIPAADYARHLLEIAANLRPASPASLTAIAMAQTSRIEGRLTMILDKTRSRRTLTRRVLLIALLPATAALMALAVLQPTVKAQTPSAQGQAPIGLAAVQLVGIMDATAPNGNGWSADGKALPAQVFHSSWGPDTKITAKPGQKALFFVLQFINPLPDAPVLYDADGITLGGITMLVLGHAPDGKTYLRSEVTSRGFEWQPRKGPRVYGDSFPTSRTQTSIRVGVPSGTWSIVSRIHFLHFYPQRGKISRGVDAEFSDEKYPLIKTDLTGIFSVPDGRIRYNVSPEVSYDFRAVAVDKSGHEMLLPSAVTEENVPTRRVTAYMPHNLPRVQEIRLEAIPITWTRFNNVALQPAK